jgi:hypothetical protein
MSQGARNPTCVDGPVSSYQVTAGRFRVGERVEIRSKAEILGTLDERGRLDGMPFMPEMLRYCGRQFPIYKRAHKTCDTVSGKYRGLSLKDSVHLDLRCDGGAHGGCQAECLLFWKEGWLKPVAANSALSGSAFEPAAIKASRFGSTCTEDVIARAVVHSDAGSEQRFSCQATELLSYTKPLPWWDPRQYAEDYLSGNVSLGRMFEIFAFHTYVFFTRCYSQRWGKLGRWLYDQFQSLRGGVPWPRYRGKIPVSEPTPRDDLGLEPGDWVRVKSYEQILATLNKANSNRNMGFDAELVPYCGKVFRVRSRVTRFIDEPTGKLKFMKTPALILDGVFCQSSYSANRLACPRSIYSWWREIWLERISAPIGMPPSSPAAKFAQDSEA